MPSFRWRLALLEGDTAGAAQALSHVPDSVSFSLLSFALADGQGLANVDPILLRSPDGIDWTWAWARGREKVWRGALRRWGSSFPSENAQVTVPVYYALLLGRSEDTMVVDAVRRLERMADGKRDSRAGTDDQALARSWLALWRLRHGDTTGARATGRWLESDEDRRYRFVGWARLIDVLLTEAQGGNVRAALLRMDSVVRELPLPTGGGGVSLDRDASSVELQNLLLARMLGRYGEPQRALAAVRRRPYMLVGLWKALPEYLREEGRLAAEVGDTAGAIMAYRHYLALRENPDPPWRAARDSVRVELAALVSR